MNDVAGYEIPDFLTERVHMKAKRSTLLRASLALVALAAGFATSLAFTAPAQAATPEKSIPDLCSFLDEPSYALNEAKPQSITSHEQIKKLCDGVTFTNKCDGTIDVNLDNTDGDFPVRFSPTYKGEPLWIVLAGTSQTQNYDPSDKGVVRIWMRVTLKEHTFWVPFKTSDEWTVPAGCLKVTTASTCQNTFIVTVVNTAPVTETFAWHKTGDDAHEQELAGLQTLHLGPFTKTDSVTVTVDKDNVLAPFVFVQPKNCTVTTTPPPTTAPPVVAPAAPLPVTGSSLTFPLSAGTALVAAAIALAIIAVQRRRRLVGATANTSGDDDSE